MIERQIVTNSGASLEKLTQWIKLYAEDTLKCLPEKYEGLQTPTHPKLCSHHSALCFYEFNYFRFPSEVRT